MRSQMISHVSIIEQIELRKAIIGEWDTGMSGEWRIKNKIRLMPIETERGPRSLALTPLPVPL